MTDAVPTGHVKLSRKAFDDARGDPFWLEPREFSRWEAWVDVLQLAAFRDGRFTTTHFGVIELTRGEFVASLRWLATRWHWTVKRVRNWVATCEKWARIRAQRETVAGTVYLVVNYDTYQSQGHSKGTGTVTQKGTAGAQQGHKIEAGKASKAVTTISDADIDRVIEHHIARHPRRRIGEKDRKAVTKALTLGYSAAELCEAIDGNASDEWHQKVHKHELTYVLRDNGLIDGFCERARLMRNATVIDGEMSPELELLTRPRPVR